MGYIKIKKGFTFLELVVVIMILGVMATIIVPNLQRLSPRYKRNEFLSQLGALVRLSWQQALITQKVHRVFFDVEKRIVRVDCVTEKKDKAGSPDFQPVSIAYLNTSYQWSPALEFKQFYIGKDEMLARPGIKTDQIWFYTVPDGLAQDVIINIVDIGETDAQGKPVRIGLVLNPFSAVFKEYEEFQKP